MNVLREESSVWTAGCRNLSRRLRRGEEPFQQNLAVATPRFSAIDKHVDGRADRLTIAGVCMAVATMSWTV